MASYSGVTIDFNNYRPMVPLQIHTSSPCCCGSHIDYSPPFKWHQQRNIVNKLFHIISDK